MKSDSGFAVYCDRRAGLSAKAPKKPKFDLNNKFVLLAASAFILWPLLGFSQSAKADGAFTVADINLALRGSAQATTPQKPSQPQQYGGSDALSALSAFAQQIAAQAPQGTSANAAAPAGRQFDDATFAALRDFAQRVGGDRPVSIKDLPKVADADNAMDALREFLQKGSAPQSPAATGPKGGPIAGGKQSSAPGGSELRRRKSLSDLPHQPGRGLRQDADGPDRQDPKRQIRLRELPRSGLGAREGRRRARRRRHHLVPAGRSSAHGGRKQRRLSQLPSERATAPIGTAARTKRAA